MDQPSSVDESGITLRIKFKSETVDHFIARYGADVSPGGIFIRTRDPLGVGTSLRFEFNLANGQSLLNGNGTVVWVREPDQSRAGVVPGMGVRFDKLTPESQNALGAILAGKGSKEGSGASRLSASRPVAPLEPQGDTGAEEQQTRPTPASMPRVMDDGAGTADPWQSDKTEIAKAPPNFAVDAPRTSEELSLSGVEAADFMAARGAPASGPPGLPPRRLTPSGLEAPKAPIPTLGSALRDAAGNLSPHVRRNSPAGGVGAPAGGGTPPPAPGPSGPVPVVPSARPPSQGLGVPPVAPAPPSRPSGSVVPIGAPAGDMTTDPYNRDLGVPAAATVRPPGRGKMLFVIGLAAMVTAGVGFVLLKKLAVQQPAPPPPSSSYQYVTSPLAPSAGNPPATTPTPTGAGAAGAAGTAPAGATGTPGGTPAPGAAATAPEKPGAAATAPEKPGSATAPAGGAATPEKPAAAPAPETPPPPAAAAAAPEGAKPAKATKTPRTKASRRAATEATEAPAAGAGAAEETATTGVEEYWLRVRSTPAGAEVLIDGQAEGKTPFERRLLDPTRPYALTLRKPGYESHEQMLSASDEWVKKGNKRTVTVSVKLTKTKGAGTEAEKPAEEKPAPTEPAPTTTPETAPPAQP
jgi:uncharacterized protein (TIGR02266 family)